MQWQVSVNGGAFTNVPGATSTTLKFTPTSAQSGNTYRAVFTNLKRTATTGAAKLTVNAPTPPVVTTQPAAKTVKAKSTAAFTAAASGSPTPTVQWQVSVKGGAFANISGATKTTYSFVAATSQSGNKYRAIFTNKKGTATSNAAALNVTT